MTPTTTVKPVGAPGQVPPTTPTSSVPSQPSQQRPSVAPVVSRPAAAAPTMAQQANRVAVAAIPANILKRLQKQTFDTRDITSAWFHGIIYGPTDARKSTVAAKFGTPENTRIVLVRSKEQLIPLRSLGYKAFIAETWEHVTYALTYPEAIWPEWTQANFPDRTLILDDITEAKDMALEENETMMRDDGSEHVIKNPMLVVRGAKGDIREVVKAVLRKPMHFIIVSCAREWDQTKSQGRVEPDLPQSIANMVKTDFEFCFYILKSNWRFVTSETRIASQRKNDKGKDEAYIQTIFAKHKVPEELEGGKVIRLQEPMDLRAIWNRIQAATKGDVITPLKPLEEQDEQQTEGEVAGVSTSETGGTADDAPAANQPTEKVAD